MRARILCAIISLSATLSQNKLPYHVDNIEVMAPFIFIGVKFDIVEYNVCIVYYLSLLI